MLAPLGEDFSLFLFQMIQTQVFFFSTYYGGHHWSMVNLGLPGIAGGSPGKSCPLFID